MQPLALFGTLGAQELLIIGGIVLLLFGGRKLPSLMKGMGEGIRELRKSTRELEEGDTSGPKS